MLEIALLQDKLDYLPLSHLESIEFSQTVAAPLAGATAPPPSSFSFAIMALTPLYMSWTRSTSERPSLRLFEMS